MTSHNMRTLEVPASKAFLLTQRTQEQAGFLFEEKKSIECFEDINELIGKIKFYLLNEKERLLILNAGYERVQKFDLEVVLRDFIKSL